MAADEPDGDIRDVPASQAYFWTPEWQRWERQADLDRIAGDYYEPADVDDLIRWLNADD